MTAPVAVKPGERHPSGIKWFFRTGRYTGRFNAHARTSPDAPKAACGQKLADTVAATEDVPRCGNCVKFLAERPTGCSIEGCGIWPLMGRGWCAKHWTRWKRHGDPLFVKQGPLRSNWTGDAVTYRSMHARVARARGKASGYTCTCGKPAQHWAYNNADPDAVETVQNGFRLWYSTKIEHYVPRCHPCHRRMDNDHRVATGRLPLRPPPSSGVSKKRRFTSDQVREIRRRYRSGAATQVELARELNTGPTTIQKICNGSTYREVV